MMQRLGAILFLYKTVLLWSFAINIAIIFISPQIGIAIVVKLFMMVFLWFASKKTRLKKVLSLYKTIGIGELQCLVMLFIIDLIITIPFLWILKGFI